VEPFLARPAAVAVRGVRVGEEGLGRLVGRHVDGVGSVAGVDGEDAHETQALRRGEKEGESKKRERGVIRDVCTDQRNV